MPNRDDFTDRTKRLLAKRVGHHCSNPQCRRLTAGPSAEEDGTVNLGVAGHITAASPGGCRYDPNLTPEQRKDASNGIWLCTQCAALIDKNENDYTVHLLREWKTHAETAARRGLTIPHTFTSGSANAYTIAMVFRFRKPSRFFEVFNKPVPPGKKYFVPTTLDAIAGPPDAAVHDPSVPLLLDASFGPSKSASAFVLQLENKGTAIEPRASIYISTRGPVFWKQDLAPQNRLIPMTNITGSSRSSIAGFIVADLLPGEVVGSRIYSDTPGPFNAFSYSSAFSRSTAPLIFDVKFGPPQLADEPSADPDFTQKHYPYG